MDAVPSDVLRYIGLFLNLEDYIAAFRAYPIIYTSREYRRKRFTWCKTKTYCARPLHSGFCMDPMCGLQKAVCISLGEDSPSKQVLSNYCSPHTNLYTHVEVRDLI